MIAEIQTGFEALDYTKAASADLILSEQPQSRLEAFGVCALSDSELLAVVLGCKRSLELPQTLLASVGSLDGLARLECVEMANAGTLTEDQSRKLVAVGEIARRLALTWAKGGETAPILNRPDMIAEFMRVDVCKLEVEKFWVLCLNRKNRLIKKVEVTSGTATSSLAHPREVFRAAIRHGATAIICVHNHPSGDPAPSAADVQVTRQLREAAKAVDIELLDHVVVGKAANDPRGMGYYSFREAGLL